MLEICYKKPDDWTYEWPTSTYKCPTSTYECPTSDLRMPDEYIQVPDKYIRVPDEWPTNARRVHTSARRVHTSDRRVHTNARRMPYEYIQVRLSQQDFFCYVGQSPIQSSLVSKLIFLLFMFSSLISDFYNFIRFIYNGFFFLIYVTKTKESSRMRCQLFQKHALINI